MSEDTPDMAIATRKNLLGDLLTTLDHASNLVRALELRSELASRQGESGEIAAVPPADVGAEIDLALSAEIEDLKAQIEEFESDARELGFRLVESEHQRGRLMNLYVATFQLHATLDPEDVQATIAEIAVDLLGADRFALLLRTDEGGECSVALSRGLDEDDSMYAEGRYQGGDPMIDACLEDGVLRIGGTDDREAVAAVPLQVQDAIVGVLVLLKLFDHKPRLVEEDRDLLDLLGAHAASALFAARVYSMADRKLRTLESLVQLVRGT